MTFLNRDLKYRVSDLGRSPSNRKKWIHYFDNFAALIFLVPLGAYDEMLNGDKSFVQGELDLFDSICSSRWLVTTPIVSVEGLNSQVPEFNIHKFLFFNKIDLFAETLPVTPPFRLLPRLH